MGRLQKGYLYEASKSFYARYYSVDGSQCSQQLCAGPDGNYLSEADGGTPCKRDSDDKYCVKRVRGKRLPSAALKLVFDSFMHQVNSKQTNGRSAQRDMLVTEFWETVYLPYCEREWQGTGMKPSTIRGFKQIWRQHLSSHFAGLTLQTYKSEMARQFLATLKTKQGKNTLKHIRALASALFSEAIERGLRREANPWHIKIPKDCKESKRTQHYTLAEAQDIISALVEHVDCQLMVALSFFLGLRPNELAALRWEDFDAESVQIRRGIVRGKLDKPKTDESIAPLPLIDQVRVPLELWRRECGNRKEGWVFESSGTLREDQIRAPEMKHLAGGSSPIDLHNVISRIVVPHVNGGKKCVRCDRVPKACGVIWKTLYAGRRGACTFAVEATNGNYAVAQALLRHKSMVTTLNVYKKAISTEAFKEGMLTVQRKALAAKKPVKRLKAAATSGD